MCTSFAYGSALKCGILAARRKYVLMAGSDDSHEFGHAICFLEHKERDQIF
jgi:hypothetical protein